MIKFKAVDGTTKLTLSDNGDMKFEDAKDKQEFEKAEEKVNNSKEK